MPKDHPRTAAYGEVDELNSAIGVARASEPAELFDDLLQAVQRDLFAIGGRLATPEPEKVRQGDAEGRAAARAGRGARAGDGRRGGGAAAAHAPSCCRAGTPKAAALHLARTVCRRAERSVVGLAREDDVPRSILVYLNRLSDLLFTLARLANHRAGTADVTW